MLRSLVMAAALALAAFFVTPHSAGAASLPNQAAVGQTAKAPVEVAQYYYGRRRYYGRRYYGRPRYYGRRHYYRRPYYGRRYYAPRPYYGPRVYFGF